MSNLPNIWTPAVVDELADYQQDGSFHEYACPNGRDGAHGRSPLVPTVRGFVCPYCDHTQAFAAFPVPKPDSDFHRFMRAKKAELKPVLVVRGEAGVEAYELPDGDAETRICWDVLRRYDWNMRLAEYHSKAVLRFEFVDRLLAMAYGESYADIDYVVPTRLGMYPKGA